MTSPFIRRSPTPLDARVQMLVARFFGLLLPVSSHEPNAISKNRFISFELSLFAYPSATLSGMPVAALFI